MHPLTLHCELPISGPTKPLQLDEAVPEGGESRIAERRPLLLMPVPAESEWVAAPRAAAARAALAALRSAAGGNAGVGAAPKRQRDGGVQEAGDASMSMMVSDATGQTTADDGDSATSRARRAAAAPGASGATQEASSGSDAVGLASADLPRGCCMVYVSRAALSFHTVETL